MTDAIVSHGPYKNLSDAAGAAYLLVDPPITMWSVVELFGEEFNQAARDGSGETWGTLFVVPSDLAAAFAEERGAEGYQVVDTYGYDAPQEEEDAMTIFARYGLDVLVDSKDLDGASDDILDTVGGIIDDALTLGLSAIAANVNAQLAEHNIKPITLRLNDA